MSTPRFHHPDALVSGEWLQDNLQDPALRIFDCTTYLIYETDTGRPYRVESGRADCDAGHIPGSGFLDLQGDFSIEDSPYRFTLPPPDRAAAAFARQGVGKDTRVILYSRKSMQWATRFWWMLRWLGFDEAAVLDGGFDKWVADGRPVDTRPCTYSPAAFRVDLRPELFTGKDDVLSAIGDPGSCTINALAPDLHAGENARYGRPGRIPGSVNVPATSQLDPETLEVLPPDIIARSFDAIGANHAERIILYCGGGIAATLDAFLLYQLGYGNISVYDNSMSQWASDDTLPIETD